MFSPTVASAVVDRLTQAGCVAAEEEAEELLAAAGDLATLTAWVARRQLGEPLAWITGTAAFCGSTVTVTPGVYVPRAQSETLARRAAALLPRRGHGADLCTGSGAIAAHLTRSVPTAVVVGTDIDPVAAWCARRNGVRAVVADLGSCLPPDRFDVVVAVTPYVPTSALRLLPADVQRYEPRAALDGGAGGLGVLRRALGDATRVLRRGGWFLTEIGGDQDGAIAPALHQAGFVDIESWTDDDGDLRGVAARLAP